MKIPVKIEKWSETFCPCYVLLEKSVPIILGGGGIFTMMMMMMMMMKMVMGIEKEVHIDDG